jgi:uncharacterized protein YegP (UPF0339 family)
MNNDMKHWKRVNGGTKYKYVVKYIDCYGEERFVTRYNNGNTWSTRKIYDTEREAAKAVDMILIAMGKEPINILKRK